MLLAKGNLNNEKTAFDIQFDGSSLCCVVSQSTSILWWLHFLKYIILTFLPFLAQLPILNYSKRSHLNFHIPTMTFLDGFVKLRHMGVGCGIFWPVTEVSSKLFKFFPLKPRSVHRSPESGLQLEGPSHS